MGFWTFIFIIVLFIGIRYFSWYRGKELPSPKKELMRLRFAILLFTVVYLLLFFVNWPSLSFYIPTFDVDINTIQDAQKALLEQNGALKKLADDTRNYNFYTFLLFSVLAADLIPAFHSFSSALVPGESVEEDIDNDKLISIFEEDKNNGK